MRWLSPDECPGLYLGHREIVGRPVLIPLGSFENRPWGPMVLDTLLALAIACRASRVCGCAILWSIGYGYSPVHRLWLGPGPDELRLVLRRIAEQVVERLRSREAVVLDGHYGHRDVAAGTAKALGLGYLNVWDVVIELGYRELEQQDRAREADRRAPHGYEERRRDGACERGVRVEAL